MVDNNETLWRIWGDYYGYPKCCISSFIQKENHRSEGVWKNSGFIPCRSCGEHLNCFDLQYFIIWLGRDPFKDECNFKNTLDITEQDKFKYLCNKYNYDLKSYQEYLMGWI